MKKGKSVALIDEVEVGPAVADIVYDRIFGAIAAGKFAPGSQLTEQSLATAMNISKTPVREAFLRLRQFGLLEAGGKRGYRVIKLSREALVETMQMREALEVHLAFCAADSSVKGARDPILKAAKASLRAAQAGDEAAFELHDRNFHEAISNTVSNEFINDQVKRCSIIIHTVIREELKPDLSKPITCAAQHVRIAEAINQGDTEHAAREMRVHLRDLHNDILAQLP